MSSGGTPTYVSTTAAPATYTKPVNLLVDFLRTEDPRTIDTRGVNQGRDNGHSFTINAAEFSSGIYLNAIAFNFEGRGNAATPEDTFDFRVFRIASGNAFANLVEPSTSDILASATGLKLPTAAQLGVTLPTSGTNVNANSRGAGTAILDLSAPIHLEPGVYGFQFLPKWTSSTPADTAFQLNRSPTANAGGIRWESGIAGGAAPNANSSYAFGLVGSESPLQFKVDRTSGSISLVNNGTSASPTIVGYEITSTLGALDRAAWKSIADNYDASPGGPGQIDSIGQWEILPEVVPYTEFSEFVFEDAMSGGVLAGKQQLVLGTAGAWIATSNESDLLATITLEGGEQLSVPIFYTGNGGSSLSIIDLDADGGLPDAADWVTFRDNFRSDISLLTDAQAMRAGDLDGDLDIDLKDFRLFRNHWEAAHGLGSFATLLGNPIAVPEVPSSVTVALLLVMGCLWRFRGTRLSEITFMRANLASRVAVTLGMLLLVPGWASAVTVTTLPLKTAGGAETYVTTTTEPATFSKPDNLVVDFLVEGDPRPLASRGVNSARNNGHSFTINAEDLAYGISLDAIAFNFEMRGNGATPDTFDFRVFRVASGNAFANLVEPAPADVLVSATGLRLPTAAELGVANPSNDNNGASGTALVNFDTALMLQPGVYGFQFFPGWDDQTPDFSSFNIMRGPGANPDGTRWEAGVAGTGSSATYAFGLVGTDLTPMSVRPQVQVNTATGEISLLNPAGSNKEITLAGYELVSPGNRLLDTWEGLAVSAAADAIGAGEGQKWEQAGESNSALLSELFLAGSSTIAPGSALSLGTAYLTGAQDSGMTFTYYNPILDMDLTLPVQFIGGTGVVQGDFNNDGLVNLADYTVWRDNLGGNESVLNGNGSGNATVGSEDYDLWKAHFGMGSGGPLGASHSTNVPEPRAALLLGVIVTGLAALRRRGLITISRE
ncbi:hypothetical protein [Aeoliella sp. SH292]|uniref:hypothetical protein n=1 Tax=Aeoliella sp. SH292 TaxID=3454464 RepID=UPI003F990258